MDRFVRIHENTLFEIGSKSEKSLLKYCNEYAESALAARKALGLVIERDGMIIVFACIDTKKLMEDG